MPEWMNQLGSGFADKGTQSMPFRYKLPPSTFQKLILLAIVLLAMPLSISLVQRKTELRSKAQEQVVKMYFTPSQATIPPNTALKLMFDAQSNQLGFARVELAFDQTKIALTQEIAPTNLMSTVVTKTSLTDANTTGRILIVLGLSPANRATPQTGIFEFAEVAFGPKTQEQNQTTTVNLDTVGTQLVDMTSANLSFTGETATIVVNPVPPTPTPTVSPTPTVPPTAKGTLTGTVIHATTGNPLPGTNMSVMLPGAKGKPRVIATTSTDASGNYTFSLDPGSYDVEADAQGFTKIRKTTTIDSNITVDLDFSLTPKGRKN